MLFLLVCFRELVVHHRNFTKSKTQTYNGMVRLREAYRISRVNLFRQKRHVLLVARIFENATFVLEKRLTLNIRREEFRKEHSGVREAVRDKLESPRYVVWRVVC